MDTKGAIGSKIGTAVKNKIGKTVLGPLNNLVDENITDISTTLGSFIVRSVRGKFQRSITFTIGINYADAWMEEALYGILYKYNNIKSSGRLELTNKRGLGDGSGMYYRLDDGTHNLKYRDYNILLCIQTNAPASMTGRISVQKMYTIITYDLSPEFVRYFEADMIAHRNSLVKIKADAPTVNVYQDLHESDGYTYWEKTQTISKRRLATIYLPDDVKRNIVNTINGFFASREYYKRHGIAHNLKILLYGPPGPQPVSIQIPTPDGLRRFGDIMPGDYVFGLNGQPTIVEDVRVYKDLDVYEVTLDDGRKILCGEDHKWPTIDDEGCFVDKTVREMLDEGLTETTKLFSYGNRMAERYKFCIPVGDEVVFQKQDVPVDPWLVGALNIPHGFRQGKQLQVKTSDATFLKALCKELNCTYKTIDGYDTHQLFDTDDNILESAKVLKDVPELLREYTGEYAIPEKYIFNTREVRFGVLQGLMDSYDGTTLWERKGTIDYYARNETLLNQMAFITRSLGFKAEVSGTTFDSGNYKGKITIFCGDRQRHLFFRNSTNAFTTMASKFMSSGKVGNQRNSDCIMSIRKLDYTEDMHCLHVKDGRHLYQTTDFAVTCNTGKDSIAKMIASEWNRNLYYVTGGKDGKFIPNALVDSGDDVNYPLFLVSDIDKYPFLINEPDVDIEKDPGSKDEQMKYKQCFGSMINALDGILSGEGRIIVMTTNHIEKFSPTFTRPGRIDLKMEIGYVTPEVLRKYVKDFYNVDLPENVKLKSNTLTIADMQFDVVFLKLTAEEFIKKHTK